MSFEYNGPGLPPILKQAIEGLAEAFTLTGFDNPEKPAHVFRFKLQNGKNLLIRIDTYNAPKAEP